MSRSGLLLGPPTAGSVAWCQAFETCPSMPPGALASSRMATAGTVAIAPTSTRVARARVAAPGGWWADMKPTARPATVSATINRSSSAPKPWPASVRSAIRALSPVSPSCAKAHATSGTVAASTPPISTAARRRSGTIASHSASADRRPPAARRASRPASARR